MGDAERKLVVTAVRSAPGSCQKTTTAYDVIYSTAALCPPRIFQKEVNPTLILT